MPGDTSTETGEWADSSTPWTGGPVGEDAGGSGGDADVGSSDSGSPEEPLGFGDGSGSAEDPVSSDPGDFGSGQDSGDFGSGGDSGWSADSGSSDSGGSGSGQDFGTGGDSGWSGDTGSSDSGDFGSGQDSGDVDPGSSDPGDSGSWDGSTDGASPGGGDSGGTGASSEADFVRDLGERLGLSIEESSLGGRQEIAAALTDLQGLYDRLDGLDRVVLDAVVEDGVELSGATDESGSSLDLPGGALLDLAARCRQPVAAVLGHARDSYQVAYGTNPSDDAVA